MAKALTKNQQKIKEEIIGKLNRHYGRTMEDATKAVLLDRMREIGLDV